MQSHCVVFCSKIIIPRQHQWPGPFIEGVEWKWIMHREYLPVCEIDVLLREVKQSSAQWQGNNGKNDVKTDGPAEAWDRLPFALRISFGKALKPLGAVNERRLFIAHNDNAMTG